jgi:hypothetical protein
MPVPVTTAPTRLLHLPLASWGLVVIAIGLLYLPSGEGWVWAAFGVGGLTIALAVWGWRTGRDAVPLFAAMFVLAVGLVVGGILAESDAYGAAGALLIGVLATGALIVHRLGRVARLLEDRAPPQQ